MSDSARPSISSSQFVGLIPEIYNRNLGPFLFEPYAKSIAARLTLPASATTVLEVAAGTGIVTRHLRARLPAHVRLVATDLNAAMLAVARLNVRGANNLEFREADAQSLPFAEASFDAVVCQFGVMFFPDKPLAARETKRVLKQGGQWLFSVWASFDENPVAHITHTTIQSFFPNDPPTFYRTPYGFHDPQALRALAEGAGFTDVTISEVRMIVEAPTAEHAAVGFVEGNPVVNWSSERNGPSAAAITHGIATALAREFGDRPLRAPMLARIVSARA